MNLNSRERLVNFLKHQNQEVSDWLNDLVTEKNIDFLVKVKEKEMKLKKIMILRMMIIKDQKTI